MEHLPQLQRGFSSAWHTTTDLPVSGPYGMVWFLYGLPMTWAVAFKEKKPFKNRVIEGFLPPSMRLQYNYRRSNAVLQLSAREMARLLPPPPAPPSTVTWMATTHIWLAPGMGKTLFPGHFFQYLCDNKNAVSSLNTLPLVG